MAIISREELKQSASNWISQGENWKYFVTLTFRKDISDDGAKHIFNGLCKRINQEIFGKRSRRRLPMFPVIEHTKDGRPHFHFLLGSHEKYGDKRLKKLIMNKWNMSDFTKIDHLRYDHEWFKPIDENSNTNIINYCLKTVKNDIDCVLLNNLRF